jgi:phage terminase small subunit
MPRKSSNVVVIDTKQIRLRPPVDLPQPERDLFVAVVAANPPTHFRDSDLPLLLQYCAAAVLGERAMAELRAAPIVDGKPSAWLAVFEKASRAMVALSMRLRLSPQSRAANNPTRPTPRLSAYEMEALRNAED